MLAELPSAAMFSSVADMASTGMSVLGGSGAVDADGGRAPGERNAPLIVNEQVITMDVDELAAKQTRELRRVSRSEALTGGWG